ncbi:MAG TPA: hypothetical protein VH234_01170 [Candidatus Saccharimonadales bacterium]|jgi:hypothetical protein|nr:hypothetical protein [Candidatus Saccharimonadales bacterium]
MRIYDEDRVEEMVNNAAERAVGIYKEDLDDRFDQVLEALDAAKVNLDKIPGIEQDVADLKSDMKIVKLAVTDTNKDLGKLKKRVTKLERVVAHA